MKVGERMMATFLERLKKRFLGIEPTVEVMPKETVVEPPAERRLPVEDVIRSRRNEDMSAEAQLAYFLDKYLYSRFPQADSFSHIERMHNKAEQLAGIDVRFTCKDGSVYDVDEKAQLYYLNKDLPTFAFEIQFLRNGRDTLGWLCNRSLKTDFYLLIWPFATQDTPNGIRWDHFTKADCLLIQKKKLLAMLEHEGLTVERMQQDAARFREEGRVGKISVGISGIYYFVSDSSKYREAPINIVVSKIRLLRMAQRRYIVTKDDVHVE